MTDKKNSWPFLVTFNASGNYGRRFMVRLYEFSTFTVATTRKASLPKFDYLANYLAFSCGFPFCLASLAP